MMAKRWTRLVLVAVALAVAAPAAAACTRDEKKPDPSVPATVGDATVETRPTSDTASTTTNP